MVGNEPVASGDGGILYGRLLLFPRSRNRRQLLGSYFDVITGGKMTPLLAYSSRCIHFLIFAPPPPPPGCEGRYGYSCF